MATPDAEVSESETAAWSRRRYRAETSLMPHFTRAQTWRAGRWPLIVGGEGCWVWDSRGKRHLDGLSGLFCVNIGYGRTDLAQAAAKQMESLAYASNWSLAHPAAIEAAETVARLAPGDLDVTFFVNSGSEAIESAIKFSRQYHRSQGSPERVKVLSRDLAYHGTTLGALSASGLPKIKDPFEPLVPGFIQIPGTRGEPASLDAIEAAILAEGPESIALLIAEPVQNGGGALVPPPGYWSELREICDRHGILLAADEVICGFGRLGEWFGSTRFGVIPDVITFAKGATSGYVPMGGLVVRRGLAEALFTSAGTFLHGATFGGHPVASAVLVANVAALEHERVLERVRERESVLAGALAGLVAGHRCVREVRGCGYFYALDLMVDRDSETNLSDDAAMELLVEVLPGALETTGLIVRPDDRGGTMLIVAPPLVADEPVLDELVVRLDAVLGVVDGYVRR